MGKKPTWTDDILNDLDFIAAEARRKPLSKEIIEVFLEAKLKSMGCPKTDRQKIIKQALKDYA